jgi:hypothetical protein
MPRANRFLKRDPKRFQIKGVNIVLSDLEVAHDSDCGSTEELLRAHADALDASPSSLALRELLKLEPDDQPVIRHLKTIARAKRWI